MRRVRSAACVSCRVNGLYLRMHVKTVNDPFVRLLDNRINIFILANLVYVA